MRLGKKISCFFVTMIMLLCCFDINTIAEVSYVNNDILNFVDELSTIENERFGKWKDANIIKNYEMSPEMSMNILVKILVLVHMVLYQELLLNCKMVGIALLQPLQMYYGIGEIMVMMI